MSNSIKYNSLDIDSLRKQIGQFFEEEKCSEGINFIEELLSDNQTEMSLDHKLLCYIGLIGLKMHIYESDGEKGDFDSLAAHYCDYLDSLLETIDLYNYMNDNTDEDLSDFADDIDIHKTILKKRAINLIEAFNNYKKWPIRPISLIEAFKLDEEGVLKILKICRKVSRALINLKEYEDAMSFLDYGRGIIVEFENEKESISDYLSDFLDESFARITKMQGEIFLYWKDYGEALASIANSIRWEKNKEALKECRELYDTCLNENSYVILNKPYQDRKAILITDEYEVCDSKSITVLNPRFLPENMTFPVGHPIVNHMYIGHPLEPSIYYPLDSYQLELVRDRLFEFCHLVQSLGATDINIEFLDTNSSDNSNKRASNVIGNVDTIIADVNASYSEHKSDHLINSLKQSIRLSQHFTPTVEPSIPDDLKWYYHEPSWKRLCEQRLKGNLLSHEEYLETSKSQMLDNQELTKLEAGVKAFFGKAGIAFDENSEKKFQEQKNAIVSIKVKFAPIGTIKQMINSSPTKQANTEDELEYIEVFKECSSEGIISEKDRKMLDRFRIKCGISVERATELEADCCISSLCDKEKEYLEIFKEIAADGEITPRKRKILMREAESLDITEERAKELENL